MWRGGAQVERLRGTLTTRPSEEDSPMNPTRSLLASTVALTLSLCLNNAAPGGDWPQFLGPDRNGVSAETGLVDSWPKEGPPVGWQKDIGEGFSGPVVAGDTVILFHRAGGEEVVEGLDAT